MLCSSNSFLLFESFKKTSFLIYKPIKFYCDYFYHTNNNFNNNWKISSNADNILSLQNGKIVECKIQSLVDSFKIFKSVHIDLGTGDGKFVYREAVKNKNILYIGIDCNPSLMAHTSAKVCKKPSRGGIDNVRFIVSPVENLPPNLHAIADSISINYPWAKLLKDLIQPNLDTLARISNLGKINSPLDIHLNYSIFFDRKYISKLELPYVDEDYIKKELLAPYKESAIKIEKYLWYNQSINSTWGKHLTLAAQRDTLHLKCKILSK